MRIIKHIEKTRSAVLKANAHDFKKDIANTQRLVEESVQPINRFARELDVHREQETRENSSPGRPAIRMKTKSSKEKVSPGSVLRKRVFK